MARDAAEMTPRLMPYKALMARDNSGGPGFDPYTAEFDDGGRVTGPKAHLSVGGGKSAKKDED